MNKKVKPQKWLFLLGIVTAIPMITACPPPEGPAIIVPGPKTPTDSPSVIDGQSEEIATPEANVEEEPQNQTSTDIVDVPPPVEVSLTRFQEQLKEYDEAGDIEQAVLAENLVNFIDTQMSGQELREEYELLKEKGRQDFPMGLLGFKLAKVLYHVRDFDQAVMIANELTEVAPNDEWSQKGKYVTEMVNARQTTEPNKIGVLLPLSGRLKLYGEKSLDAIKMAFAKYPDIQLIVEDSQGDADTAAAAVEKLVFADHVLGIIGPINNQAARMAAQKAEDLEVPIILLAFQDGLPQIGPNVFRNALTAEQQAIALSDLAFNVLHYKRFAIMYPNTSFGKSIANSFWDRIDENAGEVRGIEVYPTAEANYSPYIKRLVGRFYLDARYEYHEKVNKVKSMNLPSHREAAVLEKELKQIPPVIDFDAMFIPDTSKALGLIAPTIAAEDIILTRDKKELEKIRKATGLSSIRPVTILGNSQWNSIETVRRGGRNVEGAVFVDNFFIDNPDSQVIDFVQKYRALKAADPTNSEAQAFDSGLYLAEVIKKFKPATRAELRHKLIENEKFKGVTGLTGFGEDGEGKRKLFYLTIKEQLIQLMSDEDIAEKRKY